MRKIKSLQNFSSSIDVAGINSTDYPTSHSRQKHAVVNQEIIESQMPEHVNVEDIASSVHTSTSEAQHQKREQVRVKHAYEQIGRVRAKHAYEQIEIIEEGNIPPSYSASESGDFTSVKRSNHWSPVIQKHPRDRSRHDIPHAKSLTKEQSERRLNVANQDYEGKRMSKKNTRRGSVGSITDNHSVQSTSGSDSQAMQHQMSKYFPATKGPGDDMPESQQSSQNRVVSSLV